MDQNVMRRNGMASPAFSCGAVQGQSV